MAENILSIKEYFEKGTFVIPNYQRGFKWGVPNEDESCAVGVLMDNLIEAFNSKLSEYFIQGVTVYEKEDDKDNKKKIILVDGQQRTITFFLLLKYLGFDNLPTIDYTIRKESKDILESIKDKKLELDNFSKEDKIETYQDIYYFKKAIRTFKIKIQIKELKIDDFKNFILEKVKLFYIRISEDKATKVFSMMNGHKAIMKSDELIKSALLSKASRTYNQEQTYRTTSEESLTDLLQVIKNKVGEEWEINSLRSKYAREWDKWLYWWNREDVKSFFGAEEQPLGLLLEYYFELNKNKETAENKKYSFKNFNIEFFNGNEVNKIKYHFKQIRDLQKTFEDLYNNYETYNYLGLILKAGGIKNKALLYLLGEKGSVSLQEYAKWSLVGTTHKQITTESEKLEEKEETKEMKAEDVFNKLSLKEVYGQFNDIALKQLLRRNVLMDIELKRKFDFDIYNKKSLEHIHPKSKIYKVIDNINLRCDNNEKCNPDDNFVLNSDFKAKISEHCIGNLVLLSGPDNSSFNNKSFEEKKHVFFNPNPKLMKDSMSLLHTLSVFSKNKWGVDQIEKNKDEFLKEFSDYYKLNKETKDEN